MRAAVLTAYNAPLQISEIPDPTPGPGEVLVRVMASGVNPLDTKIRRGEAAHAKMAPPAVLGIDMAGVVEAVGTQVHQFQRRRRGIRHDRRSRRRAGIAGRTGRGRRATDRTQAQSTVDGAGRGPSAGLHHVVGGARRPRRCRCGPTGADPRRGGRGRVPRSAARPRPRRAGVRHRGPVEPRGDPPGSGRPPSTTRQAPSRTTSTNTPAGRASTSSSTTSEAPPWTAHSPQ